MYALFCFYCNGDHRDLHVLTHSFPTRRSSDLPYRRLVPRGKYRFDQFDVGGLVGVDARFGLGHGHDFRLEAETEPGARDALLNRKEAEQRADEQPWAEGGDDLEPLLAVAFDASPEIEQKIGRAHV